MHIRKSDNTKCGFVCGAIYVITIESTDVVISLISCFVTLCVSTVHHVVVEHTETAQNFISIFIISRFYIYIHTNHVVIFHL